MRIEVHKFGGTSVASAERMLEVGALVQRAAEHCRPAVCVSAMGGVTNDLLAAAASAVSGSDGHDGERAAIRSRHEQALSALLERAGVDGASAELGGQVRELLDGLDRRFAGVSALGELSSRTRDAILATGEKLSVRLVALAVRSLGMDAQAVDADRMLETTGAHGEADPLSFQGDLRVRAAVRPMLAAGAIPVITGFCGRGPDGATTTLGRGGSDFTATLVAAALEAEGVTIWTDVSGVFSTDPRIVPEAGVIGHLNYREAAEMSYYGAKVLHPRTMIPIVARQIPVLVRNTMDPAAAGTLIDGRFTPGEHPVKAVTAIRGQALVSVEGTGMVGVPGVAARVFTRLAEAGVSVTMISQSSSEASICLAVPGGSAAAAERALRREFRDEISAGWIEEIVVQRRVGLVAAVGLGMLHQPGVAGQMFTALGEAQISIDAIAQGSSELNISVAVDDGRVDDAIRAVHRAFGLGTRAAGDAVEAAR